MSVKPCDRDDVVDTWPVKDDSGRQWWLLGPAGGPAVPNMSGKPVDVRVRGAAVPPNFLLGCSHCIDGIV